MEIAVNLPLNNLSFGQISFAILKYFYDKKYSVKIFPIGPNADLSAQKQDESFNNWLKKSIFETPSSFSRKEKIFKLWHINGSLESFAEKQTLLSFYELDSPTKTEVNIVNNNDNVIFSSQYSCDVFKNCGCKNIKYIPLFFDKNNFYKKDKAYFSDTRITFNLVGKLEKRKNHKSVIQSWLKKYGNNPKYFLQCAIFNPFLKPEDQHSLINGILENKRYFNISFLNYIQTNDAYNDFLNSADIILAMSGGEGWGLPEFHSVALGKHSVVLNAHAYKDWANEENSCLVNPSGKIEVYDNVFFQKGSPFNQGNIYTFREDDFIDGCEKAINRVTADRTNKEGIKLQDKFTLENTCENIINILK